MCGRFDRAETLEEYNANFPPDHTFIDSRWTNESAKNYGRCQGPARRARDAVSAGLFTPRAARASLTRMRAGPVTPEPAPLAPNASRLPLPGFRRSPAASP